MGTKTKVITIILIVLNIILASFWQINGNIFFHTDIARDFLLMEDIVDNRNLALIGPRSGAIPGLFHGPLWLYLNLPAFVIGGGDPIVVGWFWVILYIISLVIIYYVGKKIFSESAGLLSALLLSAVTILNVKTLFNPYGALILTPLYFYFFVSFLKSKKIIELLIVFLILGAIIQFQMAFGIPLTILTIICLLFFLSRVRKLHYMFSFLVIMIPLSSHLLFEIRNNFIQTKSVIKFLSGQESHGRLDLSFFQLITLRIKEMFFSGIGSITQNNNYITILILFTVLFVMFKILKSKSAKKQIYLLFSFLYLGFWMMTPLFKGPLWNYYYLPFIPLLILIFVSLRDYLNKYVFLLIFISIYFVNIFYSISDVLTYNQNASEQDVSTWKFNKLVAQNVFEGEEKEFGYFIFTPDLYGYSPRYALNYYQKKYQDKTIYPFVKKQTTYLIIAPPPEYGKDPNSIWYKKNTNSKLWKENDIRITKDPFSSISFKNNFLIEKYFLTDEEIKVEPNKYLIKDIFFR